MATDHDVAYTNREVLFAEKTSSSKSRCLQGTFGGRGPTSVRSSPLEPLIVPGNSSIISLCGISITWPPPVYSCAYVYEGVAGTPTYSPACRGQRTTLSVFPKALSTFFFKTGSLTFIWNLSFRLGLAGLQSPRIGLSASQGQGCKVQLTKPCLLPLPS